MLRLRLLHAGRVRLLPHLRQARGRGVRRPLQDRGPVRGGAALSAPVRSVLKLIAANEPSRCFTLYGEGPGLLLVERAYWHFQNLDNANQTNHSL